MAAETSPAGPTPEGGSAAPAGWYPNPAKPGLRWWDGTTWTADEVAAPGLTCLVCQFTEFDQTQYMLNTQGMTLLGWDAFNRQANCMVCRRCGFIHWFAPAPPAHR